jgi:tetratricopeptide (TPR) repeat protein/ribosomal protein L40E
MRPQARRRALGLAAAALVALAIAAILLLPPPGQGTATGPIPLDYVGGSTCASCHAEQARRWNGSHHDLAIQQPGETTVLGDFSGRSFEHAGVVTRFYRRDGRYLVRTDGPDGRPAEFAVKYVFGVTPLEQYLLELPGGRLQALGIAWDSRPKRDGGERFFHLYPGETIDHRDVLHWTRPSQNWNTQCAECHSTNLRKGYLPAEDRFVTTFSELDVSCEACHGPGSRHAEWARAASARGRKPVGEPGLVVRFDERRDRTATLDEARGTMAFSGVSERRTEVEVCGRCHARRGVLTEDYRPGRPLAQTHQPSLLDEGLYYADGQMADEVYNWGSFLQSRMHQAGVTCSDCHDPHDAKLRAGRDEVCATCHSPESFATRRHHFHREKGPGASCVACHMRSETYMVVDERHDHSFRVPRPDLTVALGRENAPNACNDCHRDRPAEWAARAVRRAHPGGRHEQPHYATALHAGRNFRPGAEAELLAVVRDATLPGIVRGTAIALLPPHMGPESLPALEAAAVDADPLVRLGAARALEALPPRERVRTGVRLLWDPVRGVRVEAASSFADVPDAELESEARAAFDRALDEYRLAQRANAERPESHVNLGIVNVKRGDLAAARRNYDRATALAPFFVPAWINLADLLRLEGREDEAGAALRRALEVDPGSAPAHHAYGLLLVRQKRMPEALAELRLAAELAPGAPDFAYAYAIGLHSSARTGEALLVLRKAAARNPGARSVLVALVTINRERGATGEARRYARKLVAASPLDPAASALLASLGQD